MARQSRRALIVILSNLRDEDGEEAVIAARLMRRRHLVLFASLRERALDEATEASLGDFQAALRAGGEAELRNWFGGARSIPGSEEIVGLGRYGKTLTILSSDVFADDEDEEEDLKERWEPRFRR